MSGWFAGLPAPVRVVGTVVVGVLLLAALLLVYDWIGTAFLDSGGTVG